MKAMILAAGLGTRLRPLTKRRPKALVEVAGRTLLEITLGRLREFGIREVIINVHHFADMVTEYLNAHANFGMRIEISREDVLLDTGGGLKKAAWFFLDDGDKREHPFILHNVDVISNIDLHSMLQAHTANNALATLAVQQRKSSRYLLFDGQLQLCGRCTGRTGSEKDEGARSSPGVQALAFSGIHAISPHIFETMTETGAFSIVDCYLRLARAGEKIQGFRADEFLWRDLGKPENIAKAERDLRQNQHFDSAEHARK
jgi:NDP-sugar pyrophosphorylase family protein